MAWCVWNVAGNKLAYEGVFATNFTHHDVPSQDDKGVFIKPGLKYHQDNLRAKLEPYLDKDSNPSGRIGSSTATFLVKRTSVISWKLDTTYRQTRVLCLMTGTMLTQGESLSVSCTAPARGMALPSRSLKFGGDVSLFWCRNVARGVKLK